ncbi:hypothetical protein BH23PLA1_BH23PLA1_02540 [soil metagenome]
MLDRRWIFALIALAILSRVAAVLVLQSHTVPRSTYEHGEIAANLLAGRGFSIRLLGAEGPTSQQAPVYPLLVAAAYALGGVETPRSLLILQLGQAALGGLLGASVLALALEVAPGRPRIAILAALVVALHPSLVYAATHVQVGLLAATLLTTSMALAYRTGRMGQLRDAVWTGLSLAALVLTDPILGLVAPASALAIVQGVGFRRAGLLVSVVALVSVLGVAPWIARNHAVHGEPVFIKSTFGYAFWQGNCRISMGTDKVVRPSVDRLLKDHDGSLPGRNRALWAARHEAGYIDDIALSPADLRKLGTLSEPERSRVLFRTALEDLQADLLRYPALCLRRLQAFVFFDETNPKTRNPVYRAGHLALTIFSVVGWILMGRDLRRRLAPTALAAALIALFHTLTIVSARFHIPIEPLLALWGASALAFGSGRTAGFPRICLRPDAPAAIQEAKGSNLSKRAEAIAT